MLNTLLPILLFAALAWRCSAPCAGCACGGAGGGQGRPDRRPAGHATRYLVDLHHVVERDKYMSKTHVATAGGFVLSAVLAILVHGFGLHSRSSATPCWWPR
jgi:hypothetical protein